jgi:uncharacterized membrane protein HdeD (DUF308 family)
VTTTRRLQHVVETSDRDVLQSGDWRAPDGGGMTMATISAKESGPRVRRLWFLVLGALLLALGAVSGVLAGLLEVTSVLVFGPLLLVGSLMQFLTAVFAEQRKERWPHFAAAAVEAFFGFAIIAYPVHRVLGLVALVAIYLLVVALVRLGRSLAVQSRERAWTVMTGIVALLLGVSLLIGWPVTKLWLVGVCIAVDFISRGVSSTALAIADRPPAQEYRA